MLENTTVIQRPDRVTLFASCMVDQLAPNVGENTVEVLEYLGVSVDFLNDQTCCGQPAFNSGFRSEAHPVAERFIDLFEKVKGPIVVPSGSCAAMVRNYYGDLFRNDKELAGRAKRVGDRLFELTEFLSHFFGTDAIAGKSDGYATYHKCCHLLREIGVDEQPIEMLVNIEGLEFSPLERADVCCGFGGAFSVKMPDISSAILDEKLDFIEANGSSTVVAADTGCVYQMQGGLRRRGSDVQVVHIAQVLAESIRNRSTSEPKR
ncbi:MAG: (Fe-S)-binding protein [Chloroflexi bacterium]|nr:(Fe-S)-binding protein [Chloroflexota bacterium]MBT3862931.1 (Fe-S)-binding protein [Chloroflexota bacterium]MBT4143257.1 (Fe-S)-binding protein [Chloroflexota bacterium]MBT5252132.1 (Fe-S)-binding protein [Chloroflexota bacterium]MBT5475691.1 (Fe-S)-binding protein [Chloroflexota bacterium]